MTRRLPATSARRVATQSERCLTYLVEFSRVTARYKQCPLYIYDTYALLGDPDRPKGNKLWTTVHSPSPSRHWGIHLPPRGPSSLPHARTQTRRSIFPSPDVSIPGKGSSFRPGVCALLSLGDRICSNDHAVSDRCRSTRHSLRSCRHSPSSPRLPHPLESPLSVNSRVALMKAG